MASSHLGSVSGLWSHSGRRPGCARALGGADPGLVRCSEKNRGLSDWVLLGAAGAQVA